MKKRVIIYMEQVPPDVEYSDYPKGTLFAMDERKPERDPETFALIRPEKRPYLYPEDVERMMNS